MPLPGGVRPAGGPHIGRLPDRCRGGGAGAVEGLRHRGQGRHRWTGLVSGLRHRGRVERLRHRGGAGAGGRGGSKAYVTGGGTDAGRAGRGLRLNRRRRRRGGR